MSDLRDSIEQAISDSLDADWKPSWAADAIMELPEVKELIALACQYRDDLRYPPNPDSRERRFARVNAFLGSVSA